MRRVYAAALLIAVAGAYGCNDNGVVAGPASTATPDPTATPVTPVAPVAIIDNNLATYATIDTVSLSGWLSYSPTGTLVAYDWSLLAKPSGSSSAIVPSGFSGEDCALFLDQAGTYTVQLKVTDDSGLSDATSVTFDAVPSAFHVQLEWPGQYGVNGADMDLHVIRLTGATATGGAATFYTNPGDCYFSDCKASSGSTPDWGVIGNSADDPHLDVDNIDISVPENTNIVTPADGDYDVSVHYFSSHGAGAVDVTVNLYLTLGATTPTATFTKTITNPMDVWDVAKITWTGGATGGATVTPVDQIYHSSHGFLVSPKPAHNAHATY